MWIYEKMLEYPVRVSRPNPRLAKYLYAQYGGPDSELIAALRYLDQRYTMPTGRSKALLTDIGTEELAHLEMIASMIYMLTDGVPPDQLARAGLGEHYAQFGRALFYADSPGPPATAAYFVANADPIADLTDDMAAEQRARATYDHLLALSDDPGIRDGLTFLREREIVHFQRFGEALDHVQDYLSQRKVF